MTPRLLLLLPLCAPVLAQEGDPFATARARVQQGDLAGAIELLEPLVEAEPEHARAWYFLGHALHGEERDEEALEAHARAATFPRTAGGASYNAACAAARLGRVDEAFDWLERAREAGWENPVQVATDPDLEALRGDPRLEAYLPPPLDELDDFAEPVEVLHVTEGRAAGDQYGWVARRVGDVDADGHADYASTAPTHGDAGWVRVLSGRTGEVLHDWLGASAGEQFGWCVGPAGDQDGDGHADVMIGAPATGVGPGRVVVRSGADGSVLRELESEAAAIASAARSAGWGTWTGTAWTS